MFQMLLFILTRNAIWHTELGNIGPGNGLLSDGIMPLSEPMLTYQLSPVRFRGIHQRVLSEDSKIQISKAR